MVLSKDLKIAICFGLIIGALFSFCTMCFATEPEELEFTRVTNFEVISTTDGGGAIRENTSQYALAYIQLEPGYSYTFTASGTFRRTGIADNISDGEILQNFAFVYNGDSITFTSNTLGNKFFVSSTGSTVPGTITRVPLEGLDGFVDQLVYSVGTQGLWFTFLDCVPLLVLAVLWGFGFFLIVRFVIGIVKARGGV